MLIDIRQCDESSASRRSDVTWDLLLIGLTCSLEPIPITGFILTLSTRNGARNGVGFLGGWVLSLIAVIALTIAFTGDSPPAPSTAPSNAILIAKIVLGVGLCAFALSYRRREPKWMKRMDQMTPWSAALLAVLLQPWGLVAAAALTVTQAQLSRTSDLVALIAFCIVATSANLIMEGWVILSPERARERLEGLRQWMATHRTQMIVYLSLIVGVVLITRSAYALSK